MKNTQSKSSARAGQDFVVIGLGQFGRNVARRLESLGQSVLGIDIDPKRAQAVSDEITETLILDASSESALDETDLQTNTTAVVAINTEFEACALVTATLKRRGVREVITMASDHRHRDILLRVGADRVVLPLEESGLRLADELAAPGITSAMPLGTDYSLIQLQVTRETDLQTVADCEAREVSILVILRGESLIVTPAPEQALEIGDILVVMGQAHQVIRFAGLL